MVIFLFSLICTVSISLFYAVLESASKAEIEKEVKQNGDYAITIMEGMIRNASRVECAVDPVSGSTVLIKNPDGNETTFQCLYDSGNNIARIASVSATADQYLTSQTVTLGTKTTQITGCLNIPNNLSFTCTSPPSGPQIVNIGFTLTQARLGGKPEEKAKVDFETTIGLRTY